MSNSNSNGQFGLRIRKFAAAFLFLMCITSWGAGMAEAQNRTITGTVKDDSGLPMLGATVIVEQTTIGTTTGLNGEYSISVPASATNLRFSYIGMNDITEPINGRTVINVAMTASANTLDEVVVTALGIKKEAKSLSYNVQQLEGGIISSNASFVGGLTGKVAGVTINSSSAGVGGGSRVVMRGVKSISGNNNALYVIDGIPMPALSSEQPEGVFAGAGQTGDGASSLNADDIETISVLSGPSAAALYGSSAANGVIMITTKKGKAEKLSVGYSNNTTFSSPFVMPRFQNTYGQTEEGSYQSWGAKLSKSSSYDPRDYFQTGVNTTNNVSLSTGNDRNQTYVSFGATNADGIIHNNTYDRYNFNARNTSNFLDNKMTLDLNFNYSNVKEQNMISQGQYMNPLLSVYLFPVGDNFERLQIYERYDASRNFKTQYWPYASDLAMQNPYWVTERDIFTNNKNRFMTSAQLKYQIRDWMNLSGRIKLDKSDEVYEKKFAASTSTLFASDYGYYSKNDISTRQVYAEALLNINKYFCENKLSLTAVLGTSIEDVKYSQDMYGGNLSSVANLYTYGNVAQSTSESSQSGYKKQKQSIFASAQLGYKGWLYLDVTARNDWSSTLAGSRVKSFFYPTVGLSGIITDMFNISSDIMPYMKLRVSYSEVGNEPDPFLTIPTYSLSSGTPVTQRRMPNTNLKPERTKSWEVGANFYFFKRHLKLDATLYESKTSNQFFEPVLSTASGYSSVIVNAGQVNNRGIEVSARLNEAFGKFNWSTYLTYSLNENKIVSLLDGWTNPVTGEIISLKEIDMGGAGGVKTVLKEGGSMSDVYVTTLKTDEHGAIYVNPSDQTVTADYTNFIKAGSTAPRYNLSWGNDLSWKGINLNFLFSARVGGVVVSQTQAIMDYYGVSQATADARNADGVAINGRLIPAKEYYQTVGAGSGVMSRYVYSATNIRLSELTIGYDLPVSNWCNWIKGINVSFVGRNLWMLYNKAPFDPEMTANTGTYNQGYDYFMQPSTRTLGFSVKLKF